MRSRVPVGVPETQTVTLADTRQLYGTRQFRTENVVVSTVPVGVRICLPSEHQ